MSVAKEVVQDMFKEAAARREYWRLHDAMRHDEEWTAWRRDCEGHEQVCLAWPFRVASVCRTAGRRRAHDVETGATHLRGAARVTALGSPLSAAACVSRTRSPVVLVVCCSHSPDAPEDGWRAGSVPQAGEAQIPTIGADQAIGRAAHCPAGARRIPSSVTLQPSKEASAVRLLTARTPSSVSSA